jgi:hypothetical protein
MNFAKGDKVIVCRNPHAYEERGGVVTRVEKQLYRNGQRPAFTHINQPFWIISVLYPNGLTYCYQSGLLKKMS